jgi:thiamine-monophosphate kinase
VRKRSGASGKLSSEFELIARLSAGIHLSRRTILGAGDDCAIVSRPRGQVLFTIDSLVEKVHFDLRWGTPQALGARSLAVNLSDIAAMGGRPTACVVNLGVREGITSRTLERIYSGLRDAAREAVTDIVGGNITRARELSITIAILGEAGRGVMRRDAARPGDEIFVTGTLGDAALGWRILAGKLRTRGDARNDRTARKYLVERFLSPHARLYAGQRLAALRPAPAAIDVSDGLMQDLGHILERSGVGAEIDASRIPVSPAYRVLMGGDLVHALTGGEDYELIFCTGPGRSEAELSRLLRLGVRRIGTIVRGKRLNVIGASAPIAAGWDQLRSRG